MATRSFATDPTYGAQPVHELSDADTLPMEVDPLPSAFDDDEPTVAYEPQPGPPQVRDVVRVMSKDGKRAQSIGEVRRVRGHEAHVRNFGWVELRRLQVIHRKEG